MFEVDSLSYHKSDVSFLSIILGIVDFVCNFSNLYEACQSTLLIYRVHAYSFMLAWLILSRIHLTSKYVSGFGMILRIFQV